MSDEIVPPPPPNPDPPRWAGNDLAKKEEVSWPDEEKLRGQRNQNDLIWLKVYGWLIVVATVVLAFLFLVSLLFWVWHYLTPECWGWLTPDQLSRIQAVIFSGSLGAIVASILQKQLAKQLSG